MKKKNIKVEGFIRPGFHLKGNIDAQAKLLYSLGSSARVRVRDIVRMAKKPSCPFHPNFTWDVKRAANAYWNEQAQYLIRGIGYRLIDVKHDRVISECRTAVSLVYDVSASRPHTSPRILVQTADMLADPKTRYAILNLAVAELESFIAKYGTLAEMAGVIKVARRVIVKLAKKI